MVSPAPAPTASRAMTGRPLSRPLRSSGWTIRSFCPTSAGSFMVQTTLPMMRPRSMLFFPRGGEFAFVQCVEHYFVDDADDRGVHGAVLAFSGVARGTSGHDQYGFAESGIDRVDSNHVTRFIVALRRDGFHDEKLLAFQARILARRNHGADNACEDHEIRINLTKTTPSSRLSGKPFRLRRTSRAKALS